MGRGKSLTSRHAKCFACSDGNARLEFKSRRALLRLFCFLVGDFTIAATQSTLVVRLDPDGNALRELTEKVLMRRAIAIAAHPDDIEFLMAGTLMCLAEAGFEIHYMNLANGCCGTAQHDRETITAIRREEAMAAAAGIKCVPIEASN